MTTDRIELAHYGLRPANETEQGTFVLLNDGRKVWATDAPIGAARAPEFAPIPPPVPGVAAPAGECCDFDAPCAKHAAWNAQIRAAFEVSPAPAHGELARLRAQLTRAHAQLSTAAEIIVSMAAEINDGILDEARTFLRTQGHQDEETV